MTRKDYIKVAAVVSAIGDSAERTITAGNFCAQFSNDNPRFDSIKFLKACNAYYI